MLEVFIPTYNRPVEFKKCLISLEKALLHLSSSDRLAIGVAINDNSTVYFEEYEAIIDDFKSIFQRMGVAYFDYRRTGFNIGGVNNIVSGIYSSRSDYVWCLPDDDLARFDSLFVILSVIRDYHPNFISGAWCKKTIIDYESDSSGYDDDYKNRVLDVITDKTKVSTFLSKNVVQLQEYVYRTEIVKKFIQTPESCSLLNDMWPGLFALVCLRAGGSFVRLERSVGIFRDGDPKSDWRHLWPRFALIDWPQLCEKLYHRGWLSAQEYQLSVGVFRVVFNSLSRRPDILLGLHWKQRVNPFLLLKYHQFYFLNTLLLSPVMVMKAVIKKVTSFN